MKKLVILVVLSVMCKLLVAQTTADTIVIGVDYERSKAAPILIDSGKVVMNNINQLYLVNQLRFDFYEELRSIVRDSIDKNIESIVLKYEKILTENDLLFDQLETKCTEQSSMYRESTEQIKKSVLEIEFTLELTQQSLENANKSLEISMQQLSASRKSRFWNKLELLGGGIGIGLLTGIILIL